ncbi:hypothetical protein ONS96_000715 [Cadophora gregata f. sp. sojae]|nr:hypothetical protein ONS96_000715 [Cadophora gregata f. sp. sojae]
MRQIYASAEEVVAWVGPLKAGVDFAEEIKNTSESSPILLSRQGQAVETDDENQEAIKPITVASSVRVILGDVIISGDDVLKALEVLESKKEKSSGVINSLPVHLLRFRNLFAGLERRPIGLLEALTWTCSAKATDPRDKIFALLGLCYDASTYVPVPIYKQSLESIITDMTKKMMVVNRSLDYIMIRGTQGSAPIRGKKRKLTTLPSWPSDWQALWSGEDLNLMKHMSNGFKICSYDVNPVLSGSTNNTLCVRGLLSGTVDEFCSPALQDPEGSSLNMIPGSSSMSSPPDATSKPHVTPPPLSFDSSAGQTFDELLAHALRYKVVGTRLAILRSASIDSKLTVTAV